MERSTLSFKPLSTAAKHFALRLLIIGENRLELLAVEVQEERERLLHALFLALGMAVCGLLTGVTLTALIVVLLWACSPLAVLLALTCLYALAAAGLYWRLTRLMRDWQSLAATLNQLKKDRACLESILT